MSDWTDYHFTAGAARSPRTLRAAAISERVRLAPFAAASVVLAVLAAFAIAAAAAQENHSNPWLLSWIPPTCCVTNDCCWEISENELRPLPGDEWEVLATGQVLPRTDWSPDGKFYRCACDQDKVSYKWVRHQGANSRCIFVPLRAVSR